MTEPSDGATMLDGTLATRFQAGMNRLGDLAEADWRYLLPSLAPRCVLFVGTPTVAVLDAFASARHLVVVSGDAPSLVRLRRAAVSRNIRILHVVALADCSRLPLTDRSVDLVAVANTEALESPTTGPAVAREFGRVVAEDGAICCGITKLYRAGARGVAATLSGLTAFAPPQTFWLFPPFGDMRAAVPEHDMRTASYLIDRILRNAPRRRRLLGAVTKVADWAGRLRQLSPRRLVVVQRTDAAATGALPPAYLRTTLEGRGTGAEVRSWGLLVHGRYNTSKVAFYLFSPGAPSPDLVVKLTRSPAFNSRLENERRCLSLLAARRIADAGTFPRMTFFDYSDGMAAIGLRVVRGEPFRRRTAAQPDCPYARAAAEWLTHLGVASAQRSVANAAAAARALHELHRRFMRTYALTPAEGRHLERQLATIDEHHDAFPSVIQHGDPGPWNIMVDDDGRVVFLDWESGERRGMPLWDLFYFFASFGNWIGRVRGNDDLVRNYERHFLSLSPLGALQIQLVRRFCARAGLPGSLVEPLFFSCWMHRSIKESARLPIGSTGDGVYSRLLRHCIRHRDAFGLRKLFDAGDPILAPTGEALSA